MIRQGYQARGTDQKFIEEQVLRLSTNEPLPDRPGPPARQRRGRDPADAPRAPDARPAGAPQRSIRRALGDLGRTALNPLLAATKMRDQNTLVTLITILGRIGFADAARVPAADQRRPEHERRRAPRSGRRWRRWASTRAPARPTRSTTSARSSTTARASVVADPRMPKAYVWTYADGRGLSSRQVPAGIFNEVMSMRTAEEAMRLNQPSRGDAVSLWLAANNKREAELPAGETDPTRAAVPRARLQRPHRPEVFDGRPGPGGARPPPAAAKAIRSMHEVVGRENLFAGEAGAPRSRRAAVAGPASCDSRPRWRWPRACPPSSSRAAPASCRCWPRR